MTRYRAVTWRCMLLGFNEEELEFYCLDAQILTNIISKTTAYIRPFITVEQEQHQNRGGASEWENPAQY